MLDLIGLGPFYLVIKPKKFMIIIINAKCTEGYKCHMRN
jgi:hypothetical protein